jgi:hypothetical protein
LKKKLLIALGLSGIIAASVAIGAYAASDIKLLINGKLINADLQIVDGSSYVPLRVVSESLGAEVKWDEAKREISIVQKGSETAITPSDDSVYKSEELALEYIDVFLNNTDKTAMEKFLKDKIHSNTQSIFELVASLGFSTPNVYKNPKVVETTKFDEAGKNGDLVLVQGEDDKGTKKEIIVMTMDGKLLYTLISNSTNDADKQKYNEIRAKFKTAILK